MENIFVISKGGLFSTGGRYAKWKKTGKIWRTKEDAQRAIDWYNKDEEAHLKAYMKDIGEEIAYLEKELLKGRKTIRSKEYSSEVKKGMKRDILQMKKVLKEKKEPFYKGARIIGLGVVEEK